MTILGQPSASELQDLLKSHDYEISQIKVGYDKIRPSWEASDPAAAAAFAKDWADFQTRYTTASAVATGAIASMLGLTGFPSPQVSLAWYAVLRAMKQDDGTISKGDLQDLYNRLAAAGASSAIDLSKMPQPTSVDADLETFKAADAATKKIETGAASLKSAGLTLWPYVLGGALAIGGTVLLVNSLSAQVAKKLI